MMSASHIILAAAVACGSSTCPYHNDEFGYFAVFPKIKDTTVCISDGPGGRHGARLLFRRDADCEIIEEPGLGIQAYYSTFYWVNSEVAARELCGDEAVLPSNLKIDGLPVTECRGSDEAVRGWSDVTYIAVAGAPREDGGFVIVVYLDAPPDDVLKFQGTLLRLLKTIKLPHFSARPPGR